MASGKEGAECVQASRHWYRFGVVGSKPLMLDDEEGDVRCPDAERRRRTTR
jgi:hypothetical protein